MAKNRANGEGTVRQRSDGRFEGRIIIGHDEKGNPKLKSVYGKTKSIVVQKMKEEQDRRKNYSMEAQKLTLKDWLNRWMNDYMKQSIKDTTWASYQQMISLHIEPEIGSKRLIEVNGPYLQQFYNKKFQDGQRKDDRDGKLSPRMIKYIHSILHMALKQAACDGIIPYNPADNRRLPVQEKTREAQALTINQAKALLDALKRTKFYIPVYVMLMTGLRRGEVLGLRWEDINFDNASLKVERSLTRLNNQIHIGTPKSKAGQRVVTLPEQVVVLLKQHQKKQIERKNEVGGSFNKDNYLFCTKDGNPIYPNEFYHTIKRVGKKIGISTLTVHDLRHTHCSWCVTLFNEDPVTLKERMGHADIQMTLGTYAHGNTEKHRLTAKKLSGIFNSSKVNNEDKLLSIESCKKEKHVVTKI